MEGSTGLFSSSRSTNPEAQLRQEVTMSAHRAKLSSAILVLLSVSLLATACANDPTGPSITSPTAVDTPHPTMDPTHHQ